MEEITKFFDGDSAFDVAEIANAEMKDTKMDNEEPTEKAEEVRNTSA